MFGRSSSHENGIFRPKAHSSMRVGAPACALLLLGIHWALGQFQYSKLMSFGYFPGEFGVSPLSLIEGSDGALYGTTSSGGTNHAGIIFRVNKDGTEFRAIYHFSAQQSRDASIMEAGDGKFYGTLFGDITLGAYDRGSIFKINLDGTGYTNLYVFGGRRYGDPGNPWSLVEGTNGVLYGATDEGTIFRLNKDGGSYQIMHDFAYTGGGGLLLGRDGLLYGTGPTGGFGEAFKINQDGSGFSVIFPFTSATGSGWLSLEGGDGALYGSFSKPGQDPYTGVFKVGKDGSAFTVLQQFSGVTPSTSYNGGASLIADVDKILYGQNYLAIGNGGTGTVFRLSEDGSSYLVLRQTADGPGVGNTLTTMFEGSDGLFYGATYDGGATHKGSLFRMNLDGTAYTTIHSFVDPDSAGKYPSSPVLTGSDGLLYGLTRLGGSSYNLGPSTNGTFFRLQRDGGGFQILDTIPGGLFSDAQGAPPVEGDDGALYLVTPTGGTNYIAAYNAGTIQKFNKNGTGQLIHGFSGPDGSSPRAGLLRGTDGFLYGCANGGTNSSGTIFKVSDDGTGFAVLYTFKYGDAVRFPASALVEANDGMLYGTCLISGVYRLRKDGSGFTAISVRTNETDWYQSSLMQASNGILYGTTYNSGSNGFGTVFSLNTDGSGYTVLHEFAGPNGDGAYPQDPLIQGPDGALYGTTYWGGAYQDGTAFRINPNGTGYLILHDFGSSTADGQNPRGLARDGNGALYGGTMLGGESGSGTIFALQPQPQILPPSVIAGGLTLRFQTAPSSTNKIQFTTELGANWLTVTSIVAPPSGDCSYSERLRTGSTGFYRVIRLNP